MDFHHETIDLQRTFPVPCTRLFTAITDPREREVWSAPAPGVAVRIDRGDVRTGGRETGRCGPEHDMKWTFQLAYHVVLAPELVCFTEDLREGDKLLTVALITLLITPHGDGSRLVLTDQVTSFVGPDGAAGHRQGYTKALENLTGLLVPA